MSNDPTVDIGQLSTSQQDALQQYTSVTDQDVASALPILQRAQWNVQVRILPAVCNCRVTFLSLSSS